MNNFRTLVKFDSFWCTTTGLHWCSGPIESDILEDRLIGESKKIFNNQIKKLVSREVDHLNLEIKIKCADKTSKYIHLQGKFGGEVGQRKFVGIYQDITEKVLAQKNSEKKKLQMIHASKMSTLGSMAGGVAHEINNPLATLNQVFSLQEKKGVSSDILKINEKGKNAVSRIASIIQNLKNFSNDSTSALSSENLQAIVNKATSLHLTKIKNADITLSINIPENLSIACSSSDLSQAIFNIVDNSLFALKNSPIKLKKKEIKITAKKVNSKVILRISDSGPGIPAVDKQKVFEPFYTTKDYGQGSGLGLSSAKGLVENFGGSLKLSESTGAEFLICLKAV